ncbi:MAG: LamG domain-containing protein [bacterium]
MLLIKGDYPNRINYALSIVWGKLQFNMNLEDGSRIRLTSTSQVPLMKWCNVAVICDGKEAKLLLNGREEAEQAYSGKMAVNDSPVLIGGYHDSFKSEGERINYRYVFFQGMLKKISIFNKIGVVSAALGQEASSAKEAICKGAAALGEESYVRVNCNKNGPLLTINGKPELLIGYRDHQPVAHMEATKNFVGAGVKIHFLGMNPAGRGYQGDELYKGLDSIAEKVLKECPDINFLIMVNADIRKANEPRWFADKADQLAIWPPNMREGDRPSMASKIWREEVKGDLRRLVRYVKNAPYANRVLGFFLSGGSGEWGDYWDYSTPARQGFIEWLKAEYGGDVQLLRKKWNNSDITFERVTIPAWKELSQADDGIFYSPEKSRRMIDFLTYHHQLAADVAIDFCKVIKEESGNKKLAGLWNGYMFLPEWWQDGDAAGNIIVNRRVKMFSRILESPYVDFITAPYSYQARHSGGAFVSQIPLASINFHGKLALIEEDTRTYLATPAPNAAYATWGDNFGQAATEKETIDIWKRNFAGILTKPGSGLYYFGLGNDGNKWFDNPAILKTVENFKEIAGTTLGKDKNVSRIAVIVSYRSFLYQKTNDLSRDFILKQMYHNLALIGAPFDVYLDSDLNDKNFPFDKYKMYMFLNSFYLPDAERKLIKEKVCGNGNTVVWLYASGFVNDESAQAGNISSLTGIKVGKYDGKLTRLNCVVDNYTHEITQGLSTNMRFGGERTLEPVFWVDDPEVQVLGELSCTTNEGAVFTFRKPGLCVKRFKEWTSIWSGVPNLPSSLLRNIAKSAGVHIYSEGDDQVFASEKVFSIHARYGGVRKISFPRKTTIYDPFKKRYVARSVDKIEVPMTKGDTLIWILE